MNGIAIVGIIILCIVFPPLGVAILMAVGFGLFCFAGTKTVEAATPKTDDKTPAEREEAAASAFGWLVFIVVAIAFVVYVANDVSK